MEFLNKIGWIFPIAVSILNAVFMKFQSKEYSDRDPELKAGYNAFIKGFLFYGNIPWVIMGIGMTTGITEYSYEYFSPRQLNPMVVIFHGSLLVLLILIAYWIYFKNGAEFIEKHPGLVEQTGFGKNTNATAKTIKWITPLALLGGLVALICMWIMDFPQV